MMGGPIDTREAPTAVNTLATERPHAWFEQNVIATIPMTYPGAGRQVYPGFLQLAGFMTMNLGNHMICHWEMFKHLVQGDDESADATKDFYEEYRSVCDMTAEFYLQTIDVVFQNHALPKGAMMHRGRLVDPAAITDIALLAIEGERDDISGLGQTKAALTLATGLPAAKKKYHDGRGRRPLRHLQRQQMAHEDRAGAGRVDEGERVEDREGRGPASATSVTLTSQVGNAKCQCARTSGSPHYGVKMVCLPFSSSRISAPNSILTLPGKRHMRFPQFDAVDVIAQQQQRRIVLAARIPGLDLLRP